jgi:hypothetical protein
VQGACEGPVPPEIAAAATQPPLVATIPGQCVLLIENRLFQWVNTGSPTWVDNIYARLIWPQNATIGFHVNLMGADTNDVWFTNVTFQGARSPGAQSRALDPWQQANLYFGGALLVPAQQSTFQVSGSLHSDVSQSLNLQVLWKCTSRCHCWWPDVTARSACKLLHYESNCNCFNCGVTLYGHALISEQCLGYHLQ